MSAMWQLLDGSMITGDCIEVMRALPPNSVDAVVTDPPYGIGFMGHEWDQPGEHGPVRSNGDPGIFAGGRPYPGEHVVGGSRRRSQPKPETGAGHARERKRVSHHVDGGSREGVKPLHGHGEREGARFGGPSGTTAPRLECAAARCTRAVSLTANQRFQLWCETWSREALRVLKPGGHMLVSGGTRTYHRMAAGVEDAGFEVRDSLLWLYGSGFPKSRDIAKALTIEADRTARAWFTLPHGEPVCEHVRRNLLEEGERLLAGADKHAGKGTGLKPSWEPIVVARKPFPGSITRNVFAHGTGAIDIDGSRIGLNGDRKSGTFGGALFGDGRVEVDQSVGRWPPNVALTHTEDCVQVGEQQVASDGHFPAQRPASTYGDATGGSNGGTSGGQDGLAERHLAGETIERWACVPECPCRMLDEQTGMRQTPAAVRFISAEPLLGPLVYDDGTSHPMWNDPESSDYTEHWSDDYCGPMLDLTGIDWLIAGGESGPGHRPMRAEWVRALHSLCRATRPDRWPGPPEPGDDAVGTAFFLKQLGGARPDTPLEQIPADLRVREFPVLAAG